MVEEFPDSAGVLLLPMVVTQEGVGEEEMGAGELKLLERTERARSGTLKWSGSGVVALGWWCMGHRRASRGD